jgi:hypothetical protein
VIKNLTRAPRLIATVAAAMDSGAVVDGADNARR